VRPKTLPIINLRLFRKKTQIFPNILSGFALQFSYLPVNAGISTFHNNNYLFKNSSLRTCANPVFNYWLISEQTKLE